MSFHRASRLSIARVKEEGLDLLLLGQVDQLIVKDPPNIIYNWGIRSVFDLLGAKNCLIRISNKPHYDSLYSKPTDNIYEHR